jgi:hypothetical protein
MIEILGLRKNDNSIIFYRIVCKAALKMTGRAGGTSDENHMTVNASPRSL